MIYDQGRKSPGERVPHMFVPAGDSHAADSEKKSTQRNWTAVGTVSSCADDNKKLSYRLETGHQQCISL